VTESHLTKAQSTSRNRYSVTVTDIPGLEECMHAQVYIYIKHAAIYPTYTRRHAASRDTPPLGFCLAVAEPRSTT